MNALQPIWEQCRICDLIGQLEASEDPPGHGWHVVLVSAEEAKRREEAKRPPQPEQ